MQEGVELGARSRPASSAASGVVCSSLRIRFAGHRDAVIFARALLSLVTAEADDWELMLPGGSQRTDSSASSLDTRLRDGGIRGFRTSLRRFPSVGAIAVDLDESRPETVSITASWAVGVGAARVWLQCGPEHVTPLPVLALPITSSAFALDAAHAFVGLATACGGFTDAHLDVGRDLAWTTLKPGDDAVPLRSRCRGAVWTTAPDAEGPAVAWCTLSAPSAPAVFATRDAESGWWERYDALCSRPHKSLDELRAHLARQFDIPFAWTIVDRSTAPATTFKVPPSTSAIAHVYAEGERVLVAVDLDEPPALLAEMLLHLCAHLVLGHVRPGDSWGHWDTHDSILPTPHRQWDREARAFVDAHAARPVRRVSSLEECNPREKAWLVLLDHIERMVGQQRTLHAATERYQAAAYQRQAAQRLVAQLEEYGGAMLCDGVGLGKTYVATTVIVHYANQWRDQLASVKRSATADPFRITVLSPNSVVSTWQREAIAPLSAHGVPLATVRVISHSKLSRIVPSSDILTRGRASLSDMEHLLLSDLVVVDEAHNFRSEGARRTTVLRDLLRLQPRKDVRRKVLLLTATPVNNSLEDLRQQAALMFGAPLFLNDNLTPDKYRARAVKDAEDRVLRATKSKGASDVAALLIHGDSEARFAYAPEFRGDLQFGVQVSRVGDYLREEEKNLVKQQASVRAAIQSGQPPAEAPARIAGELLDRIVVQRSRDLCKQIEREQGSSTRLLFRPDAAAPEKLVYEDVYDDTRDVLARFLPLFETGVDLPHTDTPPLSLRVYMWSDVRDGLCDAGEVSSVVGLQRVLVLKRLESSPVAFLITLLRLLALHANRLKQLAELCREIGDKKREAVLTAELADLIDGVKPVDRERIDVLLTGGKARALGNELLARWSSAHSARGAADSDDPPPPQLELYGRDDAKTSERKDQLHRLWGLREYLIRDLSTLLRVAPGLADIVFGRFAQSDWPQRFINGGQQVAWPKSAAWAMRIVTDGKLRRLVARLLRARAEGQKVIVFSQFTDTLAYLESVLRAAAALSRQEWAVVTGLLGADARLPVRQEDILAVVARSAVVSGDTEDRDAVIHAFAPFYRLGPSRPRLDGASPVEQQQLDVLWTNGWTQALTQPIDVLFATDVLAEGVNLQDAALLVNFDVHWNPVRMIQRAGRIDRRLNPAIEEATSFPDLEVLARELGVEPPRYWWHTHTGAAPTTVNLLLPEELEAALQLRERIANKTLAIDFTLGLQQGTGAEADWMADYRYQGISALNAWQGDRAIEQIASYQHRLRRLMADRGIEADWVHAWNGWLREAGGDEEDPIVAWALLGRKGDDPSEYTRQIQPRVVDGVPHWLWTTEKPTDSLVNFWLVIDQKEFPALTRTGLPFSMDASRPVSAEDLLAVSQQLVDEEIAIEDRGDMRLAIFQAAAAICAGFLKAEEDRWAIQVGGFRVMQLRTREKAVFGRQSEET
jgi:superfamily II DNA or RNA helicase